MTDSPYAGRPVSAWAAITRRLVENHPLAMNTIREVALTTWGTLWKTRVGSGERSIRLDRLQVPASIVGYFLEVLFARELESRFPEKWRRGASKDEKDLVFASNPSFSVEIKTSGQSGFKVYGNRSYGQRSASQSLVKKEKSGYYLTVNFYDRTLTLLRFSWIDAEDWDPQEAPTGQMAGLKPEVYEHKLMCIPGSYRLQAPAAILKGIGPVLSKKLQELGIRTVGELLQCPQELSIQLDRVMRTNQWYLSECSDASGLEEP